MFDVLAVAVIPGIGAVCVLAVFRLMPWEVARRYAAPLAISLAFIAGYWLPDIGQQAAPERHWQWLPYLGLAAALVGALTLASGVKAIERVVCLIALAWLAAWFLVPTWDSLQPSRAIWLLILPSYLAAIAVIMQLPGAGRIASWMIGSACAIAALGTALMVLVAASRTNGILLLSAASSFGGLALLWSVAHFWSHRKGRSAQAIDSSDDSIAIEEARLPARTSHLAVAPVYAVLVGGGSFVAAIEPFEPLYEFMATAAAPIASILVMGIVAIFRPEPRHHFLRNIVALLTTIAVVLVCAVVLYMRLSQPQDEYIY